MAKTDAVARGFQLERFDLVGDIRIFSDDAAPEYRMLETRAGNRFATMHAIQAGSMMNANRGKQGDRYSFDTIRGLPGQSLEELALIGKSVKIHWS